MKKLHVFIDALSNHVRGKTPGKIVAIEKALSSRSRGYRHQDKIEIDGKRHEHRMRTVEKGSKAQVL